MVKLLSFAALVACAMLVLGGCGGPSEVSSADASNFNAPKDAEGNVIKTPAKP